MENAGRLMIELTRRGDIIDQSNVRCKDCGIIVKLNDKVPYETRNWLNHIKTCRISRFPSSQSRSSSSSSYSDVVVDDIDWTGRSPVSSSNSKPFRLLKSKYHKTYDSTSPNMLPSVRISGGHSRSVKRNASFPIANEAVDIQQASKTSTYFFPPTDLSPLDKRTNLCSSSNKIPNCQVASQHTQEESDDPVECIANSDHTDSSGLHNLQQTPTSDLQSTHNKDTAVDQVQRRSSLPCSGHGVPITASNGETLSTGIDRSITYCSEYPSTNTKEPSGLDLLANCVMFFDNLSPIGSISERDDASRCFRSSTERTLREDIKIPPLSFWYPRPPIHPPDLPPPEHLPVTLKEVVIHRPLFSFEVALQDVRASACAEQGKETLPPLPLTLFLNVPISRTARRERMRLIARKYYFRHTLENEHR